ncbi:TPA: hypothetical protein DEG24_04730 [Candidatus Falkowbacteria bacterium]|nr:hypothetical protein [Candidatus Falkowbacteria bacterium]HBY15242.1 hypothetical protein [Candidatus Falkowbacteria bacterium]
MSAKDMAFDFITTAITIVLCSFVFFYFIVAGHWETAEKITRSTASASVFSIFFFLKLKTEKTKIIKHKEEASLDDVLVYFTNFDKTKDLIVIIVLTLLIAGIAWYDNKVNTIDVWQMIMTFSASFIWHCFLFRKKEDYGEIMSATVYDRIKDQIFVFFLPIVVLTPPLLYRTFDIIDQIQIVTVFGVMYAWHKYLIRKRN